MSLQTRLDSLITAIGADIKALQSASAGPYLAGVVANGSTDNTTVIQTALNAAAGTATTASGLVHLPKGFIVTGPLNVPHGVTLKGCGPRATTLLLNTTAATATSLIKNSQFATMCSVSDMRLDGQKSGQGVKLQRGLVFDGGGSNGSGAGNLEYTDVRCQAHNLVVQNFSDDGVTLTGRGACQINSIQCWNNGGHGFNLGIDSIVSDCDAGNSAKNGFNIAGNPKISNCKAWFSGWNDGAQITANYTAGADYGNGFHFNGSTSGAGATNIEAQDNARAGIYLEDCDRVDITGWTSDSNNNNTVAGPTTYSNIEIKNTYDSCITGGFSFDRNANARRPRYAATLGSGSNNIVLQYMVQGFTNGAADYLDPGSVTYGNTLTIGNCEGSVDQSFASTFIPDNTAGAFIHVGALTANMTVSPPRMQTSALLSLHFVQDATGGRTLTWNAVYNTAWQPSSAPSAVSTITFKWNSANGAWDVIATAASASALLTRPVALTDVATIATNAALGNHFRVTLGGNRTLGNPTNPSDGQKVVWELIQDGTGTRTITLGSAFALGTDITAVTLTTTLSKRDFLGAIYNSTTAKWYVTSFIKGF